MSLSTTTSCLIKTSKRKEIDDKSSAAISRPPKVVGEGDSFYHDDVFSSAQSVEILRELDENILYLPREQFQFKIFNTVNLLPRDKAFYGDVYPDGSTPLFRYEPQKDAVYPDVQPWPPVLERLRDRIFEITGQRCNHCVVNQYRDQNDHIGFHFDKVRDFADGSSVLTLSFGGERILRLKHQKTSKIEDISMRPGSLFVLGWKTNSIWKHSIVKRKRICQRRVSLTFRSIKTRKQPDGTLIEMTNEEIQSSKKMKTNEE